MKEKSMALFEQLCANNPNVPPQKILENIQAIISHYQTQAERHARGELDERLGLVQAFYNTVDALIFKIPSALTKQFKCKKGCAHCCKIKVEISQLEAEYIYEYAKAMGIAFDVEQLKEQSKLDVDNWHFSEYRNCVFLAEDNSCKIYEARPISCRQYLVTSDPDHCDLQKGVGGVMAYAATEENCIGAALALVSDHGSLPQMLLKVIKLKEDEQK